jgi:Domain of Unknown Function (DUF1080)
MIPRVVRTFVVAAAAVILTMPAWAMQPPADAPKPRPGGRGPRAAAPDDNTGFKPIFDGKTLENWEGEPGFWRVEDGVLTGETTDEKKLKLNTFIIWRGGTTADFEFKAEFRLTEAANSGVQYRSTALPDVGKYVLKGYQADIDGKSNYTGMLYEERGRGFVAPRGQFSRMAEGGTPKLIGSPGEADVLKAVIKVADWNQIHIIARGNVIIHVINGRVMSMCFDEDAKGRAMEGLLGLQLHVGPPMKVEYRNILLKQM